MGERTIDTSEPVTDGSDATVDPLPSSLDSTTSKLVYLYLQIREAATIDEIQSALGVKKIALYPSLRTLVSTGLVRRVGATYLARERAEGAE